MKILLSSLTYPLKNGVTNSIDLSVDQLSKKGHSLKIIAPKYDLGKVRAEHIVAPSSTISRIFLELFGKKERLFSFRARSVIEEVFNDFKPDVCWLHTVTWPIDPFGRVALDSDVGKVLTYHTMIEQYGRVYAGELGARLMIGCSKEIGNAVDRVIAPSQIAKEKLLEYGIRKPIEVVPTGIAPAKNYLTKKELCRRYKIDDSKKILLYVGRVSKEKNISALFEMLSYLAKSSDEYVLLMVGPGDLDNLKEEAKRRQLADKLVLTGSVAAAEAKAIYGGADAFVFASLIETQGLVIGEAMIAKLPIVALRSPIQPEIYPERFAVICDSPQEMASAIRSLLTDQGRVERLTRSALEFVKDGFSPETMADKQERILLEACKESKDR